MLASIVNGVPTGIVQTAAGAAMQVKPIGMSTAAWIGVISLPILGAILGQLIKIAPRVRQLGNERETSVAQGLRDDMQKMRDAHAADMLKLSERISALETKLEESEKKTDTANDKAHKLEMKLVTTVSAVTLLSTELRKHDPESPALIQASELIRNAMTGDFGFERGMEAIAAAPAFKRS